ncbi:LOG family protein [Luteipulveratus flavus]|uniref:Cytokinin riboside 5'-monophosphate phosphoribohydrolase n=1 Tax=Luteipulveratus flavus TaxID=3031728 RepID=A0ABT6C5A8_9MICO|nr:TIGR00730 family Rossman fold protein [Luteipulveratus sp. YIM 133296]MDF8263743.1 TIGR00730 family Rossman fold protein [Luteipulveratus sp. YIM 133296]
MRRVALFTGSSFGADDRWRQAVADLTAFFAERGVGVVYGGASVGLMGVVADTALAHGVEVIGVIPRAVFSAEVPHHGLTELIQVESMHERKAVMASYADAFVALPGGLGTLEEIFEVWTWRTIGLHDKPVAFYDVDGYWSPLLGALDHMVAAGFVRAPARDGLVVADRPDGLWAALSRPAGSPTP